MNHSEVKDFIQKSFTKKDFKLMESTVTNTFDMIFQHPDMGYNIFFKFYDSSNGLEENWPEAQYKVDETIKNKNLAPYNSYLVLGIPEKDLPSAKEIQRIVFDEYACRKLIFPIDSSEKKLRENILRFPFYPLDISQITGQEIPKGVVEALSDTNFDPHLISDITGRVATSAIIKKIFDSEYKKRVELKLMKFVKQAIIPEQRDRRLKKVVIENFRGIGREISLNLDADIIVIYGPNGTGKTSIFDAIEWGITGQVDRLQKRAITDVDIKLKDVLINLFHKGNLAKIDIEIGINSETKNIKRSLSFSESGRSKVKINDRSVQDKTVIAAVTGNELIMPRVKRVERFRKGFLASHTLKQEVLSGFITHTDPKGRYESFSYLTATQDFVRFRNKTEDIIKGIEQEIKQLQVKSSETTKQVNNLQREIANKEKELSHLSKAIASFSRVNLITEVQQLIKKVDLPISKGLIDRLRYPTQELAETIVDVSSKYMDSCNKEIDTLTDIVTQGKKVIQIELKKEQVENIINTLTREAEKLKEEMADIKSEIDRRRRRHSNLEKSKQKFQNLIENIDWLIRIKPLYEDKKKRLGQVNKEIKKVYSREEELNGKKKKIEKELTRNEKKLLNREKQLAKKENLVESINLILDSLPEWKESIIQLSNITEKSRQINKQLTLNKKNKEQISKTFNNLINETKEIESQINLQKKGYDERIQLVGKLKEYIDSPECPLCGHKWENMQILLSRVEKETKELPESLKTLMAEEKKLIVKRNQLETKIAESESHVKELKHERDSLILKKRDTESKIENWEKQLSPLTFNYIASKIKGKKFPQKESLVQYKANLKTDIEILYKDKVKLEKTYKNIMDEYESLNKEINKLKTDSNKVRKSFKILNNTIEDIQKAINERGLTEFLDKDIAFIGNKKDNYLKRFQAQIVKKKLLDNEIEELKKELSEIEFKDKEITKKLGRSKTKLEEFHALQKVFFRTIRPYIQNAEGKSLPELVSRMENLKNKNKELYQLYLFIKKKANNLKRVITLEIIKTSIKKLQEEKSTLENQGRKIGTKLRMLKRWITRLEELKREVVVKREQQEKSHFELFKPTANLIYQRLNPHPLLGSIEISFAHEELKIISKMKPLLTKGANLTEVPPSHIFSESQLNTLAISIFLASALEQGWSRFRGIFIDDPVQNMDDLNSYAFLDLILGLANNGHQFIISTCNRDFYKLMLMKFSCLNKSDKKRFIAYRLQGIYEDGPTIIQDAGVNLKKK